VTSEDGRDALHRLMSEPDEDGSVTLGLLRAIQSGYPMEDVRKLLHSDKDFAAKAGAWILSELGPHGRNLIDEVPELLRHRSAYVRHFGIDALTSMAGDEDGPLLAKAVALIEDDDVAVRGKALRLLAAVPVGALHSASTHLPRKYRDRMSWLTKTVVDPKRIGDVVQRIGDADPLWRKFAVAAATRLAEHSQAGLESGAKSDDPDVSHFAALELAVRSVSRHQ
jgi:hypothetical protein